MSWFYNMKIAAKLITGFVLVAIIAGIVGVVGIINLIDIEEKDNILYENMTVPIINMAEISTSFERVRIATRDIILANTPQEIAVIEQTITGHRQNVDKHSKEFEKKILSQEVRTAYNEFLNTRVAYGAYLDELILLARENKDAEGTALLNSAGMTKAVVDEQAAIEKLFNMKNNDAAKTSEENSQTANTAMVTMIIFIVGGMVLAIILGVYISKIISNPVKKIVVEAEKIADGNLDTEIDINTKDEIGVLARTFKKMADNLNDVMININNAAEQVASGSKQVSDSGMALSQGATEQASSIEQLTASLEEISSQTKLNAQNANQANELAETAKTNAVTGNNQMKDMLQAMEEINVSSSNISKIIKVIDEIAFQTNILALNAAVEAARAGQHGKGFAVVAEEVRNLAARSANAAKETTDLIEGSIKKAENGTKIANETAVALNKIVEDIAKAASLVGEIAVASNEQAVGIAQVNQGITQVSEVVQTNSATSEESAAASEELSSQAELLKETVARFKVRKVKQSFNKFEEFNPEMIKMLEDMTAKKKAAAKLKTEPKSELVTLKPKIALSDKEFGKY